jgi:hypothetical protein
LPATEHVCGIYIVIKWRKNSKWNAENYVAAINLANLLHQIYNWNVRNVSGAIIFPGRNWGNDEIKFDLICKIASKSIASKRFWIKLIFASMNKMKNEEKQKKLLRKSSKVLTVKFHPSIFTVQHGNYFSENNLHSTCFVVTWKFAVDCNIIIVYASTASDPCRN